MEVDWNLQLAEQLDLHWRAALRPRLDGLTDEEYFWEPVAGCWSVRRRGVSTAPIAVGAGEFTFEFAYPAPDPAPVTTIAWRLAHMIVGLATRNGSHFGGPDDWSYAMNPMCGIVTSPTRDVDPARPWRSALLSEYTRSIAVRARPPATDRPGSAVRPPSGKTALQADEPMVRHSCCTS